MSSSSEIPGIVTPTHFADQRDRTVTMTARLIGGIGVSVVLAPALLFTPVPLAIAAAGVTIGSLSGGVAVIAGRLRRHARVASRIGAEILALEERSRARINTLIAHHDQSDDSELAPVLVSLVTEHYELCARAGCTVSLDDAFTLAAGFRALERRSHAALSGLEREA